MKKIVIYTLLIVFTFLCVEANCAEPRASLVVDNYEHVDISEPLLVTLTVTETFEKAEFMLDDNTIGTVAGGNAGSYDTNLDLSSVSYLGEGTIVAYVTFADGIEKIEKSVNFEHFSEEISFLEEQFASGSAGSLSATPNNGSFSNVDGAMCMTIPSGASPFVYKNITGINENIAADITLNFDLKMSAPFSKMTLEMRGTVATSANPNKYFWNGSTPKPSVDILDNIGNFVTSESGKSYSGDTWYNIKIQFTTYKNGFDIYVKGGDYADYTLIYSMPEFHIDGLGQIRLSTGASTATGTDSTKIYVDNLVCTKKEMNNVWYAKTEYRTQDNINASKLPVENGRINLVFSDDMSITDAGKVTLKNINGATIAFTTEVNEETRTLSLLPVTKLNYNSKYFVEFASGITSVNGKGMLTTSVPVTTEKLAEVNVGGTTASTASVSVDAAKLPDGAIVVLAYYVDGELFDIRFVEKTSLTESSTAFNINKPNAAYEIKTFILSDIDSFEVLQ